MTMTLQNSNIGFHSLSVSFVGRGPATLPPDELKACMMVSFEFSMDIEFLFPYINSVAKKAQLFENPPHIRFNFDHTLCVLHPEQGFASPVDDSYNARTFIVQLMAFLNDIYHRKNQITPRYKFFTQADITQILKLLPQTNCNECGFDTCMAFAAMLSIQQTIPGRCPHISLPVQEKAIFPIHDNNGRLLSTISLDIDNTENVSALNSANQYIENLEKKIRHLSCIKSDQQDEANKQLPTPLSQREIQILQMLACGTTNMEIAQSLNISPHTVKSHVNHIFNKLGVNSRTQASVWATQHHFI